MHLASKRVRAVGEYVTDSSCHRCRAVCKKWVTLQRRVESIYRKSTYMTLKTENIDTKKNFLEKIF